MPPSKPLSPAEVAILAFLSEEALNRRGWLRKGVRGWRLYSEITEATGEYIPERLPYLARRGLLERIDVQEFGRERRTTLYRISKAGASLIAEIKGHPPTSLRPALSGDEGGGNILVPAHAWSSLATLRKCAVDRIGPVRLGAHGWLTAVEVHRETRFRGEDLTWLLRRGLVERREVPSSFRPQMPLTYYRISDAGLRTEYVDAVPSPSGRVEFVEARVGEVTGPNHRRFRTKRRELGSRRNGDKSEEQ